MCDMSDFRSVDNLLKLIVFARHASFLNNLFNAIFSFMVLSHPWLKHSKWLKQWTLSFCYYYYASPVLQYTCSRYSMMLLESLLLEAHLNVFKDIPHLWFLIVVFVFAYFGVHIIYTEVYFKLDTFYQHAK